MKKDTLCVHSGNVSDVTGAVTTPIQPATAYAYLDADEQLYPRYFNTTNQNAIVQKVCALEGAEAGIVFSSGMAAISTLFGAVLRAGDHVVLLEGLYGGTQKFVDEEFERLDVRASFASANIERLLQACTDSTRMIYVESPTNPLLDVVDLEALASAVRSRGILTAIDNTFASPMNQNPVRLGIDVVVHSGTKYLGGHSDLSCGVMVGPASIVNRVRHQALNYGGNVNAITCYLLERSLKTLSVRVERQNATALRIGAYLERRPEVTRVRYPGLSSHPAHEVARRQMTGFGGMLSFELESAGLADRFLRRLRVITPALSLGGVDSTICIPAVTSHRHVSEERCRELGIHGGLLRLSVGIEDADDLIGDLDAALSRD